MNRADFDHVIRAAASILGVNELIVIGSQAVHASISSTLPEEAQRSVEVDILPIDDPDSSQADLIDGSIGEASMFHDTFGIYAQGVGPMTAVLPDGWKNRLVRYTEARGTVTALCLELHDLWISKAIAGRPKDRDFCDALLTNGLVQPSVLRRRVRRVARASDVELARARAWIEGSPGS